MLECVRHWAVGWALLRQRLTRDHLLCFYVASVRSQNCSALVHGRSSYSVAGVQSLLREQSELFCVGA